MSMRRYYLELGSSLALYAALLVGSLMLLRAGSVPADGQIAVALLPMVGAGAAAWAIWRQFRRFDEMQRKLQFDILALAFLGTALLSFGYGFLENFGFPKLSMFTVWPVMGALWAVGSIGSAWRYRR